jgi:hypothetical protein
MCRHTRCRLVRLEVIDRIGPPVTIDIFSRTPRGRAPAGPKRTVRGSTIVRSKVSVASTRNAKQRVTVRIDAIRELSRFDIDASA